MASHRFSAPIALLGLVALIGCGGGGSLVGREDASVTVAFGELDVTGPLADLGASDFGLVEEGKPVGQPSDATAPDASTDGGLALPCEDRDGDGFGLGVGCRNIDCDDSNGAVTDQCYRCREPATGCACRGGELPVSCDYLTDRATGSAGVCHLGQRNCTEGRWTNCQQWRQPFRYQGPVSPCAGSCAPGCRHQVTCPEAGHTFLAGTSNVTVGAANPAVFCPVGTGRGGVTTTCTTGAAGSYTRSVSPRAWIDACTTAGRSTYLPYTDDSAFSLSLPFDFSFYGAPFNQLGVSSNGIVGFPSVSPQYWNVTLPYASTPNSIFAFWDDLYMRDLGVCTVTTGAPGGRLIVIQWSNAYYYANPTAATDLNLEVVLEEGSNTIDVIYGRMVGEGDRSTGSSATIGIPASQMKLSLT